MILVTLYNAEPHLLRAIYTQPLICSTAVVPPAVGDGEGGEQERHGEGEAAQQPCSREGQSGDRRVG